MAMTRTKAILLLSCLVLVAGCAGSDNELSLETTAAGSGLTQADSCLQAAILECQATRFEEAKALLVQALRSDAAYSVMPSLLYQLGQCEMNLGKEYKAVRSFRLLRDYYPRRWSEVPNRDDLTMLISTYEQTRDSLDRQSGTLLAALPSGHDAQQRDNSLSPSSDDRAPKVSNLFYETPIQQALADISAQTGVPIISGENVRGAITAEFIEVPLEECLRRLLEPFGLSHRWMGSYYLVGKADPNDPGSQLLLETVQIRPRHLLAKEVPQAMPNSYGPNIRINPLGGNTLTATGSAAVVDKFVSDLDSVDKPSQQVMIEALVVELTKDMRRDLGINWELVGNEGINSFRIAQLPGSGADSAFVGQLVRLGGNASIKEVRSTLRAMESRGEAKVRANPSIMTMDGQVAKIRVGSEAYYSLLSGSVSYSYYTLQKIATGVTLTITPYIGASAEIITDIEIEVSDVSSSGLNNLPVTSVREVKSRARVDNGQSLLIGGLLSESERDTNNRLPILGRIPLIGGLFGQSGAEKERHEVFVLLTTHIIIHPMELASLLD